MKGSYPGQTASDPGGSGLSDLPSRTKAINSEGPYARAHVKGPSAAEHRRE